MIEKKLLSLIIPVYNVEKFLTKTLDSVLAQTYKNMEILCVNDGSTDSSREILTKYEAKDSRITIIDKQNGGLSSARNTGLDYANGEYIAFLDSDDWVSADFYEKLISRIETDKSDIAIGETHYVYKDRITQNEWVNFHNFKGTNNIVEEISDKQNLIYACACWNKVYRTKLIKENNLSFPHGLYIEDVPFTFKTTILANKISLVKDAVLFYRQQENSIMSRAYTSRIPFDIFEIYNICELFLSDLRGKNKEEFKKILDNFEIFNIWSWFNVASQKYKEEFFNTMQLNFSKIDITNNKYITQQNKKLYKMVIESNSYTEFEKKSILVNELLYLKNNHIDITLEILKEKYKNKKILLYGAGRMSEALLENYNLNGLNIIGISDRKFSETKPNDFYGLKPFSPNEIATLKTDIVLLLNKEYDRVLPTVSNLISKNTKIISIFKLDKFDI